MFGFMRQWLEHQRAEELRRAKEHVDRIRQERERMEMAREERAILSSLGFDLGNGEQNWLRQAQLMREHHDQIAELQKRVERLEGRRDALDDLFE